jgi:DNA polymerase-4
MPIARALKLCPEATCVPVPRQACSTRSRKIAAVLARFAPVVQASSIDEWYCDLGGTEALYGHESLAVTAHRIRAAVREATGLNVSIGGGTSRLVAKMAVEVAKPKPGTAADGVHCVAPGDETRFLADFKLADLPMVGPRFAQKLERMELVRISEAQAWSEAALTSRLGERAGPWLYRRVRGLDDSVVTPREHQKQVSREETFARDLDDEALIDRELLRLAVRVSTDLRRQALRARTVTVKLRDKDFTTRSAQRTLSSFIESERSVARAARQLLRQLRGKRRIGVRLLGIALSHFDTEPTAHRSLPGAQLGLFAATPNPNAPPPDPEEGPRDRALTRALDRIRDRYGSKAILPAQLVDRGRDPDQDIGPRVEE